MVATDESGKPVSSRRLELLTRTRFPVIGGADWDRLAEKLRDDPSGLGDRDREAAAAVLSLITRIRSGLAAIDAATSWAETAVAVDRLVTAVFRQSPDRAAVLAVVVSLADLDTIAPAITRDRVVGAISSRMDSITEHVGDEGAGVALGRSTTQGDLDTVCGRDGGGVAAGAGPT